MTTRRTGDIKNPRAANGRAMQGADLIGDDAPEFNSVERLLFDLLLDVVGSRQPEITPVLKGAALLQQLDRKSLLRSLQALGIWFQLLNIAEQNIAMSRRRRIETKRSPSQVQGTFAQTLADAVSAGVPASEIQALLHAARVHPVITAHPTESKRVTVLEVHRRIYLLLVELENTRWTPREYDLLVTDLRNEIDLLWLTGEIFLEKTTVRREVGWGQHFFNESLFDAVPRLYEKLEHALEIHYPGERIDVPPFFRFDSWIGGDRDGNPFVTNDVTRDALASNREQCLRRHREQLDNLLKRLSVANHTINVPESFLARLHEILRAQGHVQEIMRRNPGEIFRQFIVGMLRKLDATIHGGSSDSPCSVGYGYRRSNELVADLRAIEQALSEANCESLSKRIVRPVRREAEVFGFSTVTLDLRENTAKTNAAFVKRCRPPNSSVSSSKVDCTSSVSARITTARMSTVWQHSRIAALTGPPG